MPIARLITRTPEFAQRLALSLEAAGYSIEFISPEDIVSSQADLEVNLDDPSAASSYLVTANGKEISFAYDPVEREFVLAPAWRRLMATFAPIRERFRRPEPEVIPDLAGRQDLKHGHAQVYEEQLPQSVVRHHEPAMVDPPIDLPEEEEDLTPTTVLEAAMISESEVALVIEASSLPVEPAAQSLYLPDSMILEATAVTEPVQFSGVEYFDGQGARRRPGNLDQVSTAPPAEPENGNSLIDFAPPAPATSQPQQTQWLVQVASLVETLRSSIVSRWDAGRAATNGAGARLRSHDASWLRAAPVAALIALAFLLGWSYSDSQRPAQAAHPVTPGAKEASITPVNTPLPARSVQRSAAVKPASAKHVATSRRTNLDDEDTADDVVVRHYTKRYPAKEVRASNQKNAIKRFSDIN